MGFSWRSRRGWKELLANLYREYRHDHIADSAAALSYYFVFSLFPFLFFLFTLAAYIPHVQGSMETLLREARALLPAQAMRLIDRNVRSLLERPHPHLLTVGLATALYAASRGVDAVRKALNLAYDVDETRPFWRTKLVALSVTAGGAVLVLVGIAALVAGGDLGLWLAGRLHVAPTYVAAWRWLRWPITATLIMLSASVGYHLLPNLPRRRFRFVTPGAVIGTVVWLAATWGFDQYASHFSRYNVTYGSIGGVVALMTWFYLSGFIFLIGGEINATLESTNAADERPGPVEGSRRAHWRAMRPSERTT